MPILSLAAALALLAGPPAPAPAAEAGAFCRIVLFPGVRSPDEAYFIAVAEPDMVWVDVGSRVAARGADSTAASATYVHGETPPEPLAGFAQGQRVRVERIAGASADAVERAFARAGRREAVLVPWGYDSRCRTRWYERSGRWIEPGKRGFVHAAPRPESEWTGGVPVFDVFYGGIQPYPHTRPAEDDGRPWLSADELLDLWVLLPVWGDDLGPGSGARRRASAWLRADPGRATRYPAPYLLGWHPAAPRPR
ncbi:MAG TPA: hypothetical protein VHG91_17765 [Longimicrobium sp.]|nr:hypothetical protein [Longimicrobium sp.]